MKKKVGTPIRLSAAVTAALTVTYSMYWKQCVFAVLRYQPVPRDGSDVMGLVSLSGVVTFDVLCFIAISIVRPRD